MGEKFHMLLVVYTNDLVIEIRNWLGGWLVIIVKVNEIME